MKNIIRKLFKKKISKEFVQFAKSIDFDTIPHTEFYHELSRLYKLYQEYGRRVQEYELINKLINQMLRVDPSSQLMFNYNEITQSSGAKIGVLHAKDSNSENLIYYDGFDFNSLVLDNLIQEIISQGVDYLAIDFQNVVYFSDLGISSIDVFWKELNTKGGGLFLFSVKKDVKIIADLIWEGNLKIFADRDDFLEFTKSLK